MSKRCEFSKPEIGLNRGRCHQCKVIKKTPLRYTFFGFGVCGVRQDYLAMLLEDLHVTLKVALASFSRLWRLAGLATLLAQQNGADYHRTFEHQASVKVSEFLITSLT